MSGHGTGVLRAMTRVCRSGLLSVSVDINRIKDRLSWIACANVFTWRRGRQAESAETECLPEFRVATAAHARPFRSM